MSVVLGADETNLLRGGEPWTLPGHSKPGGKPRPIRKRAFWRALKRGDFWAVIPYEHAANGGVVLNGLANRFARIIADKNCPRDQAFIMWPMEGA